MDFNIIYEMSCYIDRSKKITNELFYTLNNYRNINKLLKQIDYALIDILIHSFIIYNLDECNKIIKRIVF